MKRKLITLLAAIAVCLGITGTASAAPVYSSGGNIFGGYYVGTTLTAEPGTWTYDPAGVSYSYTWKRDGAPVGTGQQYTSVVADVSHKISLTVSATDATGTTSADVAAIYDVILWPLPVNNRAPVIMGNVSPGGKVTLDRGDWSLPNGQQPGPITYQYNWWLTDANGSYVAVPLPSPPLDSLTIPDDAGGKTLHAAVYAGAPSGSPLYAINSNYAEAPGIAVPSAPAPPPPPAMTSTTNIKSGQKLSGTVRWTVQASAHAHAVKFYNNNVFITEAVADADNWAIDLNTKQYSDGVNQLGYDIYNAAGVRVFAGTHIPVTIDNTIVTPPPTPPPTPPAGGGGSGGGGGSSGGGGSATPPTPPAAGPGSPPTPPVVTPPVKPSAKLRLLNGGFAQTSAKRGKTFSVAMYVVRSDNGKRVTAGKVTCKLAGLKPSFQGWFKKSAACGWNLSPKLKKGKRAGWIQVKANGVVLRRAFTTTVK